MHQSSSSVAATRSWLLIELGGSSAQSIQQDGDGRFWFTSGVVPPGGRSTALACPGVIRDNRVLYATNLGWPEEADPKHELGIPTIKIVVNDAVAAALGESVLRSDAGVRPDLIYLSLGTGVGSAAVQDGIAYDFDIGHLPMGGAQYCEGCQSRGCLNSLLAAKHLPQLLTEQDYTFVARQLATALYTKGAIDDTQRIVLGGGIVRRHPGMKDQLARLIAHPISLTLAPPETKSAAYAGLAYLAQHYDADNP
jgi:predicted NBD/HSP70 family sugar kinase